MPAAAGIACAPPPGQTRLPEFDGGWLIDGRVEPFLTYAEPQAANWSADLESFHEESSRSHFLDTWTRSSLLGSILLPDETLSVVADIGCSSGYLLEDMASALPDSILVGVDLIAEGLEKAHVAVPAARLLQADVCELPLDDASLDAIVSANLLEHVADDGRALEEFRRTLRHGGTAAIVVPAGPGIYDYYDTFLGHERRYARGELADKARQAGFRVMADRYLGSLIYPAFWLVKKRNRRRYGHLSGVALAERVARDIEGTKDSRVGALLRRIEEHLPGTLPFGVRNLVVVAS